jgi:hypothetical protein
LQLVSWVAKTCTNMSRLVANTYHPMNNHYNSNPDTSWTNLIVVIVGQTCRKFYSLYNRTKLRPVCCTPFGFNVLYQSTSLINLRSQIFGLTTLWLFAF